MRILAPLDGTPAAYEALDRALLLLRGAPVEVTLLHVRDAGAAGMADPMLAAEGAGPVLALTEAASRDVLARGIDLARRRGARVMAKASTGLARNEILREAAHHDVLVMHHLGASRLADWARGHDADRLAREATCAVLLVGPAP